MKTKYILPLILFIDAVVLFFQIGKLSISYDEAQLLYDDGSLLSLIIKLFLSLFGQNDFALRSPMILLHLLSVLLLYKISKKYLNLQRNRFWLIVVFILLPGVISSAIVVNSAGFILFLVLLFVYIHQNYTKYSHILSMAYLFIDPYFLFLFLALTLYYAYKKESKFLVFNIILTFCSFWFYGIDTHGTPRGYFLDSIGLYAAIFTPIVFIYFVYALYRKAFLKDVDLLWFIASTSFIVSMLLSFRQKISVEYFSPFMLVALVLLAQTFEHSYRVRLPIFRKKYRILFYVAISFLVLNSLAVFFNGYLYSFLKEPSKHFAHKYHIAKELSAQLKQNGIDCISSNEKISKRLEFYGVAKCSTYKLFENYKPQEYILNVTISYNKHIVYNAYVTKINN